MCNCTLLQKLRVAARLSLYANDASQSLQIFKLLSAVQEIAMLQRDYEQN